MLLIISLSTFQIEKKKLGQKEGPVVKSTYCSCREPELIPSTDIRQLTGDLTHSHTHLCRKESGGLLSPVCFAQRRTHTNK